MKSLVINATSPAPKIYVDSIAMNLALNRNRVTYAQAKVTVKDVNGAVIAGATVSGTWSGIVSGSKSAVTSAAGVAVLDSPTSKKAGTFKYTVTGITAPGFVYDATLNKMTTNSITK